MEKRSGRRGLSRPPADQLVQPVLAAGDERNAPDGTRLRPGKKTGILYKPIRLMHRQIELINDADHELMYEPRVKRRFATWPVAWRVMLEHVWRYPHWEWWIAEDLLREPELGPVRPGQLGAGGWSQICRSCRKWGVVRVAPHDARCLHCGTRAYWLDRGITTEPRCSWREYREARELGAEHRPDPLTPRYRAGPEDAEVPPRERILGTDPGTHGFPARTTGDNATDA